MFKIYLLPKDIYLSKFDIGLHITDVQILQEQILYIRKEESQLYSILHTKEYYTMSLKARIEFVNKKTELTHKIASLNKTIREIEETAKNTIGLVNSKDRAEKAIKYYRNTIDSTYLACEFIIMKAKL